MKYKSWKKYYKEGGEYLQEHKDFLTTSKTKTDCDFIIKALNLKKSDKIIDLACGDGRITVELAKRGFNIEGLDFSQGLLRIARKKAEENNVSINFHHQDLHSLSLKRKYNKAFIFFSHFGILDPDKIFRKINQILEKKGKFLLDCDNLFRLVTFLLRTKNKRFSFDPVELKLYDNEQNYAPEKYYFYLEIAEMIHKCGVRPIKIYGDYGGGEYSISSPRMIVVGEKNKVIVQKILRLDKL